MIDLHLGDCLDYLESMDDESVDLVLTDPPYGISYKTSWRKDKDHRFCSVIQNDEDLGIVGDVFPHLARILKQNSACFVFCSWDRQDEVAEIIRGGGAFNMRNRIIWDKCSHTAGDLTHAFGHQYEVLLMATKGDPVIRGKRHSDLWRYPRVSPEKLVHQNQKPVELLERAILSMSDVGDVVLDPFMGSGSTGVACLNTGRNFVGIELDEGYYRIARERLEREESQGRLFVGEG